MIQRILLSLKRSGDVMDGMDQKMRERGSHLMSLIKKHVHRSDVYHFPKPYTVEHAVRLGEWADELEQLADAVNQIVVEWDAQQELDKLV